MAPDEETEVESAGPDIREEASTEPGAVAEDHVRVPTADETSAAVERANRALAEIRAREEADARHEEEDRAEQLAQWQARDVTSEAADDASEPLDASNESEPYDLDEVDA